MSASLPPALVLTAGLGTRLDPVTRVRAKAAVPIAGRPMVLRVLDWLASEGVRDAVLNLHHRPESITRVVGHGDDSGLRVRYSWEPVLLGSAGGPRRALPMLDTTFLIVNGDTLTDVPLAPLLDDHRRSGALVTLATVPHPSPTRYGAVRIDEVGNVVAFTAAGRDQSAAHFIGVQVVEAAAFASVPTEVPTSTIGDLYERLIETRAGAVRSWVGTASFHDVGTPADYLDTVLDLTPSDGVVTLDPSTSIHPSSRVTRSEVWREVAIEADCRIDECIVTDGVHLPAGTALTRQICVAVEHAASASDRSIGNAVVFPLAGRDDRPS